MTEQLNSLVEATHKTKRDSKTYAMALYGGITLAVMVSAVIAGLAFGPAASAAYLGWIGLALSLALGTVFVGYVLGTKTLEAVVAVVVGQAAKMVPSYSPGYLQTSTVATHTPVDPYADPPQYVDPLRP